MDSINQIKSVKDLSSELQSLVKIDPKKQIERVKNSISILTRLDDSEWEDFTTRIDESFYFDLFCCLICKILGTKEIQGDYCECRHSYKDQLEFLIWAINYFWDQPYLVYVCKSLPKKEEEKEAEEEDENNGRLVLEWGHDIIEQMKYINIGEYHHSPYKGESGIYILDKINSLWNDNLIKHDLDGLGKHQPKIVRKYWERLILLEVKCIVQLIYILRGFEKRNAQELQ